MTRDEMKNRISMALKDPTLQQGFEIICKENAELKKQNANLIVMLKSEREVRVNDDYLKGICERDAEIDELKEQLECAELGYNKANEYAKTIIQDLLDNSDEYARERAINFLEEKK